MHPSDQTHYQVFPRHLIGLLAGLTIGWGLNWPIMKVALSEMAPLHFRSVCLVGGAAGLFAIAWLKGLCVRVPPGQWGRLIAVALVNVTGWNMLVVYGVRMMASGRAAILGYTMPAWGVLLSTWLLREPLTRRRLAGVALGIAGMLLLLAGEARTLRNAPLGALLVCGAAALWALGSVMMKRWPVDLPTTTYTAWQMVFGAVPFVAGALLIEPGTFNVLALSPLPALATVYNVLVAFVFCYWAWNTIVLAAPVGVSSLSVMMTPVVGVASGMALLGEAPHWYDFAALAMVVGSLATVLVPVKTTTT